MIKVHICDSLPSSYNGKLRMKIGSLACQSEGCGYEASVFLVTSYTCYFTTRTDEDPSRVKIVKRKFAHVSGACYKWHHQRAVREYVRRKATLELKMGPS